MAKAVRAFLFLENSVVNGNFLTLGGAMHQPAQIPADFLHGHCFHPSILLAIRLKGKMAVGMRTFFDINLICKIKLRSFSSE